MVSNKKKACTTLKIFGIYKYFNTYSKYAYSTSYNVNNGSFKAYSVNRFHHRTGILHCCSVKDSSFLPSSRVSLQKQTVHVNKTNTNNDNFSVHVVKTSYVFRTLTQLITHCDKDHDIEFGILSCMYVTMPTIHVATVLLKAMLQMHAILLRVTSAYQAYQICLKHVCFI